MLTIATFLPVQDTTLFENSTNAYGAGPDMFVGNANSGSARRSLLQFDLSEQIPPGSVIYEASLQLALTKTEAGPQTISLSPILADWGEGSSSGTGARWTGRRQRRSRHSRQRQLATPKVQR